MFATESIISVNNQVMVDFDFKEEFFIAAEVATTEYYQQLVAQNVVYLILAVLSQWKRSRGMHQTA